MNHLVTGQLEVNENKLNAINSKIVKQKFYWTFYR